jgi:hypothetical protein
MVYFIVNLVDYFVIVFHTYLFIKHHIATFI